MGGSNSLVVDRLFRGSRQNQPDYSPDMEAASRDKLLLFSSLYYKGGLCVS